MCGCTLYLGFVFLFLSSSSWSPLNSVNSVVGLCGWALYLDLVLLNSVNSVAGLWLGFVSRPRLPLVLLGV